jgi:hypothetical protein
MTGRPVQGLLIEGNPGDARLLREMLSEAGSLKTELTQHGIHNGCFEPSGNERSEYHLA